jgi:ubiquitin-like 1-activating enzyme E1 B
VAVLLLSIALYHEARPTDVGNAAFDKDDDLAVEFVTAAANLRSHAYGIPTQVAMQQRCR